METIILYTKSSGFKILDIEPGSFRFVTTNEDRWEELTEIWKVEDVDEIEAAGISTTTAGTRDIYCLDKDAIIQYYINGKIVMEWMGSDAE